MRAARDLSYRLRVLLLDLIGGFKPCGMKAASRDHPWPIDGFPAEFSQPLYVGGRHAVPAMWRSPTAASLSAD